MGPIRKKKIFKMSDAMEDLKAQKKEKKSKKDKSEKKAKKEKKEARRKIQDFYSFPNVELGRGAFSVVHLATDKKTGEEVAVKVICKKDLGEDFQKNLDREIEILTRIQHKNIIALKDLFETKHEMYIVMELVSGGELFDKIVEKGSYTEQEAAMLIKKVLSAIQYLHSQNIVHRDLKPENLLIVGQATMMATACGTPSYVAPEVLNATGYDSEVDLWSV